MGKLYRALIVEDNAGDADLIRELMPDSGPIIFHLDFAIRLSSALTLLRDKKFDIILLDLGLPDISGLDTLRAIKESAHSIPIVVLTGFDDEKTGIQSIQEGAQDFIIKGQFSRHIFSRILCYAIERHQNMQLIVKSEQFLRATLDALSSNIAIIDENGIILEVNKSWREFAEKNQAPIQSVCEGANYLYSCREDEQGILFSKGIQDVLSGDRTIFEMEYPCHSPDEKRWFRGTATRFNVEGSHRIVVAHENITERIIAEGALAYEQYLMKTLMNYIPDCIFFKDIESKFIRISRSQASLLGLHECSDAIGMSDHDFYTKEYAKQTYEDEQNIIKSKKMITKEEKATFLNNSELWISSTKLPLYNNAGTIVGTFGISRNISANKLAEQAILASLKEKEFLLKEIHHRVKNNLQIILSFISLQKHNPTKKEPIETLNSIETRIQSISIVHELVYQSASLSEIHINKYMSILLTYILGQYSVSNTISYKIQSEEFVFNINLMVPIGIILNELTTNAAKHAFDGKPGEITISITKEKELYTLVFHDNGKGIDPLLDLSKTTTLGMNLIYSLIHQIEGTIKTENDHGAKVTISFKDINLASYSDMSAYKSESPHFV